MQAMVKSKTVMLTLRVPSGLRAALQKAAKDDHRSVNNLVVAMLRKVLQS
jgi:hypothetical protein